LGVVAALAHRVAVMYAGQFVEQTDVKSLFAWPLHPYTQGLINCVPNIRLEQKELVTMPGSPPDLVSPPPGCRFAPRCPKVMPVCREKTPELLEHGPAHGAACWLYTRKAAQ